MIGYSKLTWRFRVSPGTFYGWQQTASERNYRRIGYSKLTWRFRVSPGTFYGWQQTASERNYRRSKRLSAVWQTALKLAWLSFYSCS